MRVLDSRECRAIGGAGAPNVAEVFHQTGPGSYTSTVNGVTTSVVCTTPFSASFSLGISTTGKLVDANTGLSFALPQHCTTTINDTVNHTVLRCNSDDNKCTITNTKTGDSKQVSMEADDSGLEQLAETEGNDIGDLFADNASWDNDGDWSASGDDGGYGGDEGGGGGGGGDGGGDGDGGGGDWGDTGEGD